MNSFYQDQRKGQTGYAQMVENLQTLKKNMMESYSQDDYNKKFEKALYRELLQKLMEILNRSHSNQKLEDQEMVSNIEDFIEFLLSLERVDLISKNDLLAIFDELFECTSEDSLPQLFKLFEKKIFKNNLIIDSQAVNGRGGKLDQRSVEHILNAISKICKCIMRKLSVTHDTGFRGKILKLIASVFPLAHPSGINRIGLLNTKNITNFESEEEVKEEIGGSVTEYKQYKNFWTLQKYLTNPFNIFTGSKLEFEDIYNNPNNNNNIDQNEASNNIGSVHESQSPSKTEDQLQNQKELSMQDEEEGQIVDTGDRENSLSIMENVNNHSTTDNQAHNSNRVWENETNLSQVLLVIRSLVVKFLNQPLQIEKENAQLTIKYPKYLSKYSLLRLQSQDYLFREAFMIQVLIFVQGIQNPINLQQKKLYIVSEDEKKLIKSLEFKINQILATSSESNLNSESRSSNILGKRQSLHVCSEKILSRELNWDKWKENKCLPFNNFFGEVQEKSVSNKRRNEKYQAKLLKSSIYIQAKEKDLNYAKNGLMLRKYLNQPKEKIFEEDSIDSNIQLSSGLNTNILGKSLLTSLQDQDPDQGIEEAYKKRHDQVWGWRFLRQISMIDLVNFHGKPELQKQFHKFEGNTEVQSLILHERSKKREVVLPQSYEEPMEDIPLEKIKEEHTNGDDCDRNGGDEDIQKVKEIQNGQKESEGVQMKVNGFVKEIEEHQDKEKKD